MSTLTSFCSKEDAEARPTVSLSTYILEVDKQAHHSFSVKDAFLFNPDSPIVECGCTNLLFLVPPSQDILSNVKYRYTWMVDHQVQHYNLPHH